MATVPLLVMVKVTTPEGKVVVDSSRPSSVIVTVTSVAPAEAPADAPEEAGLLSTQPARPKPARASSGSVSAVRRVVPRRAGRAEVVT